MRRFIIAAAMAAALVALWAMIVPLTAQPAPQQATPNAPALSRALFLCRGPHGIDQRCAAALAKAMVLPTGDRFQTASDRSCRADPHALIREAAN